jgi:thioredoxin-dependent peroxiredoxin
MSILPGIQAPDFALPDEDDKIRHLSDFRGRVIVLYFYPKDDTPGCTTEACNFRDNYSAYVNADVVILGVSPDSAQSHDKFKKKFTLPFPLLVDKEHKICQLYGVWGVKKFAGREFEGVLRTTILIDAKGKIIKIFKNVKPSEHSAEVLAEIKSLCR